MMNQAYFAELQKENGWFTLSVLTPLPAVDAAEDVMDPAIFSDDTRVQRHVFGMIFGGFGCSVDLPGAKAVVTKKLAQLEKSEPKGERLSDPEYVRWVSLYAQYYVLLGTIFAYQQEDVLAAYCLMKGLKTGAINLFMPYCEFIRSVLLRVEAMPAELAHYEGRGFSVDEPMGSPVLNGGMLLSHVAEEVLAALKGQQGEVLLLHHARGRYGRLRRVGSAHSERFRNCVDVYETLLINSRLELKRVRFYFNGYFDSGAAEICLPAGFCLEPASNAASYFRVVE